MILSALLSLVQAIIYWIILYNIGKILQKPDQIRLFLRLKDDVGDHIYFKDVSEWVIAIGRLFIILAYIGAAKDIVNTLVILSQMNF